MRIGLTTSVIQGGRTGIARYVFGLLEAFQRTATPHRFVLFVLEGDLPLFAAVQSTMEIVPVPECFRPPVRNILWHQRELPQLARRLGLDVLHVPSYRRMLWPRPCALVATIHDLAPFHVTAKYDWARMVYGRVVARRLAARQDAIIAVSATTARDVRRFFHVPAEKITVVPNGLDHARFHPAGDASDAGWAAERHALTAPFFLYVARLEHPAKNHVRLIAAFDKFKTATRSPWQLVFAGADWHGAEAIHAARAASPFARDIRSLGFVTDADLPRLYRAAGVFVYPSHYEGFGLPPIEAMACGCPVLTSPRGALGEVVGHAALTVDPDDQGAWERALARLSGDEADRAWWREAGLARARDFNWDRTAQATLQVYATAAAPRGVGAHPAFSGVNSLGAKRA